MPKLPLRVVLDTNTILRGLLSERSAAARVLDAAERRTFVPLLSKPVLAEYADVLSDPELVRRFPSLTERRVRITLARLRFVGDYVRRSKVHFAFERDPTDVKFVEPAITGDATHILSADADLLSLRRARDEAARRLRQRLPRLQILSAGEFAHAYAL